MNLLKSLSNLIQFAVYLRRLDPSLVTKLPLAYIEDQRRKILSQERYQDPKRLNKYEYQVFSQSGEDGIIAEMFSRIGVKNKTFLEIGVGNGLENNTTFPLFSGWTGFWIDANKRALEFIEKHFEKVIQIGRLKCSHQFVNPENINSILNLLEVPTEIDLLSIDIDRNTYWVLESLLSRMSPRAIVVEYNALIPPSIDWKVERAPLRIWNGTMYFGASLKAYELLGRKFGYSLVCCETCGINAFLVKNELCKDYFFNPLTSENHYEPLRDYLVHRIGYRRAFDD